MRILIYGAGVIGSELAHVLIGEHNDVTLLARGKQKEYIDKNGLVIKHYLQMHTSIDKVKTVEELKEDDTYDLIFISMQYEQINNIVDSIVKNKSKYFIFVGNNMNASYLRNKIVTQSKNDKEIAFAFQGTGGRRENGKVISIHCGLRMTIGGMNEELSEEFWKKIRKAFKGIKYALENNMDSWLKCHAAFILPICYVCYKNNGNLKQASKKDIKQIIGATVESHKMLKSLGYEIRPEGEEKYFTKGRKKCYYRLKFMAKTPLGRLAASDHAMHAVNEMKALDKDFEELRSRCKVNMPIWDNLRKNMK